MMRTAKRNCPICACRQVEALHSQRFVLPGGHPLSDGYDVVVCLDCGFVFADVTATQLDYDRYYAQFSKYEDSQTSTGAGGNPSDRQRLKFTASQIANFLHNPNLRILDIGCANGGLLKELESLGYRNLCGIDPSPACVKNTRALGIDAHLGSLFQPFHLEEFDVVVLSHTLEHVQEFSQAMDFVRKALRPNSSAILFAEVPDASRYKDFVFAPFQDFNTEHINHFSLDSLENLMLYTGFTVVASGAKLFETSPGVLYPAIYVFAQYTSIKPRTLVKDELLKDSIHQYIEISRRQLGEMEMRIQQILATSPRLIVWGTGQLTMKLLAGSSLGKANIAVFVDSNPINQGKELCGVRIISPEETYSFADPILIASTLHQRSIAEQIRRMGFPNPVLFLMEHGT